MIVAATDFRPRADRAIDRALALGKQLDQEVTLVHALDNSPTKKSELEQLENKMREILPAGQAEPHFAFPEGKAPEAIAQVASDIDASLVVLGPARHNSLTDYILGNAVDYAVRHCEPPVLVVKKRPRADYRRIMIATDFSEPSKHAIAAAAQMFPGAELHLLHCYHVPFAGFQGSDDTRRQYAGEEDAKFVEFTKEVSEELSITFTRHLVHRSLHEAICEVVDEENIDLIVLGSRGESGFRHATLGSQANAALLTTPIDTMIVSPVSAG